MPDIATIFGAGGFSGHGYLLIGGLILVGAGLLIVSLVVNQRVARSVRADERHREKLFEYYRNTFSQIGVILIGIGISLFIFFFQQNYQDQRKRETELQQLVAKTSVRLSRAAALVRSLGEYDEVLFSDAQTTGPADDPLAELSDDDLVELIEGIRLVERDIDLEDFSVVEFSKDFETSMLVSELDPRLWFSLVEDESDVRYASIQLRKDYGDLDAAIGDGSPADALADPERRDDVLRELLDILYDMELLRDKSRRLVARGCWFVSSGTGFVALKPIDALEREYEAHEAWIAGVEPILKGIAAGGSTCYDLLHFNAFKPG